MLNSKISDLTHLLQVFATAHHDQFFIKFQHLFFSIFSRFDPEVLIRFTLTVRKNYRRVPYHNWSHAFTVAHCMYCVVKASGGVLTGLEVYQFFYMISNRKIFF